jgi:hypothetical protein
MSFPDRHDLHHSPCAIASQAAEAWQGKRAAVKMSQVARGWMKETTVRTWPGPGRRLQWKLQRAWGWFPAQGVRRELLPSRLEEKPRRPTNSRSTVAVSSWRLCRRHLGRL